jgi:hypothetical protein
MDPSAVANAVAEVKRKLEPTEAANLQTPLARDVRKCLGSCTNEVLNEALAELKPTMSVKAHVALTKHTKKARRNYKNNGYQEVSRSRLRSHVTMHPTRPLISIYERALNAAQPPCSHAHDSAALVILK